MSVGIPIGACSPANDRQKTFTVNINVTSVLSIETTTVITIKNGCTGLNASSNTTKNTISKPGPQFSFPLRFKKFGGNNYQCQNEGAYRNAFTLYQNRLYAASEKWDKKLATKITKGPRCYVTEANGVDSCGRPKTKRVPKGTSDTAVQTTTVCLPSISGISYNSSAGGGCTTTGEVPDPNA